MDLVGSHIDISVSREISLYSKKHYEKLGISLDCQDEAIFCITLLRLQLTCRCSRLYYPDLHPPPSGMLGGFPFGCGKRTRELSLWICPNGPFCTCNKGSTHIKPYLSHSLSIVLKQEGRQTPYICIMTKTFLMFIAERLGLHFVGIKIGLKHSSEPLAVCGMIEPLESY